MNRTETIEDFYQHKLNYIPRNLGEGMGHFNVFRLEDFVATYANCIPYSRKDFFKISLIIGRNQAHYADQTIHIEKQALLFANPQIPYNWEYLSEQQSGYFCIFTEAFFHQFGNIKEYPVFKPGGTPLFLLDDEQLEKVKAVFLRIMTEMDADYAYKYDAVRAMVLELVHLAQKMLPATGVSSTMNAGSRITHLFMELLERQFPIESPQQSVQLRSPVDFARQLSVHVNHLNRAVKETTGKTTSHVVSERLVQEAKALLLHSDWQVAEIGYTLGFEEPAHFANFFKKHTAQTPSGFRAV